MNMAYYVLIIDRAWEVALEKFKMEMIGKNTNKISASMEWISLYIDLRKRKVAEFEDEKIKLMDDFIRENKSNFSSEGLLFSSKLKR